MKQTWVFLIAMILSVGLQAQQAPSQGSPATAKPGTGSISPTPAAGYRIGGLVVNALTGDPVPGVSVVISPMRSQAGTGRRTEQTLTTGVDGRFAFDGLTRGKYSLNADAKGYGPQGLDRHDDYATGIAVGPNLDSEHILFRLQPFGSIAGTVSDDQNEPVRNARVLVFRRNHDNGFSHTALLQQTNTEEDGSYRVSRLIPGTYFIAVVGKPWYAQNEIAQPPPGEQSFAVKAQLDHEKGLLDVTYPVTFYPDTTDWAAATPILVHIGERVTADVLLHAVPSAHLRIQTGMPAGSVAVMSNVMQLAFDGSVIMMDTQLYWEQHTMVLGGLPPGHYFVKIQLANNQNRPASGKMDWGLAFYRELDVAGDTEIDASQKSAPATVDGKVAFEGASPAGRMVLRLRNRQSDETAGAEIDAKGEFRFESDAIRPGSYDLALGGSQGYYLKQIAASGAKITGRNLEISGGGAVHLACLISHGVGTITGMAVRNGKGIAGVMVLLVPQDPTHNLPLFRRDQSDSDGTFTLQNVLPGRYTLLALQNGWDLEWGNPSVLSPYLKSGTSLEVHSGQEADLKVEVQ